MAELPEDAESDHPHLGWNLLWYVPLCVGFCSFFLGHNFSIAWRLLKLVHRRWSWWIFASPSAALFFGTMIFSFYYPIYSLLLIRAFVLDEKLDGLRRRYFYVAASVIGTFALALLVEAIMWGSFPLDIDAKGVYRLRLIPFFPWPDGPYNSY